MENKGELIYLICNAILRIHSDTQSQFRIWCNSLSGKLNVEFPNHNAIFEENVMRYLSMLNEQATLKHFVKELLAKVNDNQKQLPEFVKLRSIFEQPNVQVPENKPEKLYAFVITGTNDNVRSAIGDELFDKQGQLNHHDVHDHEWRPFILRGDINYNIEQILNEFKAKYGLHQLNVIFLKGKLHASQIVSIDNNKKNIIAIVDLLALDRENETNARRFDSSDLVGVFTPISNGLDLSLVSYMKEKNEEIFSLLTSRYSEMSCYLLQSSSEKNGMLQALKIVLEKKVPLSNKIADLDSLSEKFTTINPDL